MDTAEHVVGVDAGGTSTRALAVDAAGAVLGRGRSGGANPNSHVPEEAAARIAEAITEALTGLDPSRTRACVVGMAGTSKLTDPAIAAVFDRAWERAGVAGVTRVTADAEVAFASATSAVDGTVLIAGTGSIAGRIRKHRLVSTTGGHGWLLGDEGSAFWLGREAVRATLATLDGHGELTGLAADVLTEALGMSVAELVDTDRMTTSHRLITLANAEAPVRLARFAPLVSAAERAGDPVAKQIVHRAADLLVAGTLAAREPGEDTPVVLVGSVLGENSPVSALVRAGLSGLNVLTSSDGVLGAAWLAAVDAFGENASRPVD
ncbi:MAG: N-acetylglucosamine kinase [Amycolatopsis sp.]|uniref:N-acetylglucosamine kinase n=1 Tax=Amycolatopsis sp. TaxID=37632 RepID=UPI0026272CE4|nr:BadF/BadG/BcrA/BcrD ATPase family protein [Amycolatopsis sp.]MCU1681409.1 N-acetylglucosamine kinase [Amycolatopsis sp.]